MKCRKKNIMIYHGTSKFTDYSRIYSILNNCPIIRTNKKIEYFNIAVSFDIETSSFEDYQGNKAAIMYIWAMDINGHSFIGRTWDEWLCFLGLISEYLETDISRRIIIYVHNLAYEFQFIRKYFEWDKVFAVDTRKPVYAVTKSGIEFRCSYLLSGYSLEKLGTQLKSHKVRKMVGDLDYKLLRHSGTKLTARELSYCICDVKVVTAYINERMKSDGDITRIPLTKTGYVRRYCKESVLGKGKRKDKSYRKFIKGLTLTADEYLQLKRAFQGGFTHANPFYSGLVLDDVSSFDFTSSYPSVMVSEKFPMFKSELVELKNDSIFYNSLKLYCCLFDVYIEGLESRVYFDSYLSISRCWSVSNAIVNNGRIVSAERLYTTLTEQDFLILSNMYTWECLKIANFRRYKKAYLPSKFVDAILTLYQEKTLLKGVNEKEYDYARSKEMLNSAYGMIVTDICRDENIYDGEWRMERGETESQINKYNISMGRFLFYPWGVWVTAYARRNLFTGILSMQNDYVYSDTDSIKVINKDSHDKYIENYNEIVTNKVINALSYQGIELDKAFPKTLDGIVKPMGVWDYEGTYQQFKTLGAKRYLIKNDKGYQLTVSGLQKKAALDYMLSQSDNVFNFFNDEMYIPKGHTGKMIHTYIDDIREGVIQDYKGEFSEYSELSSVHLDDADYSLKLGHEYADYLLGLQHMEE